MANKQVKELSKLSKDELLNKVRQTEAELFQARMQKATGQLQDTAKTWRLRKTIARAKTLASRQSPTASATRS